jgi:hypothetical protein
MSDRLLERLQHNARQLRDDARQMQTTLLVCLAFMMATGLIVFTLIMIAIFS